MEYFEILHLKGEPFSNSPDPNFFYAAPTHLECLHKLEIAVRLRRGLNLVLGDVGAGKTTMSRVLLQEFEKERERFRIHLVLDPGFQSDREMLVYLLRLFGVEPSGQATVTELIDQMQHLLFQQGVEEDRVVVLLIDEGQKLSPSGLEILRELLNFESNQFKLLQVVVFAQLEFWARIQGMPNILDRMNMIVRLRPLSLKETRALIQYRLAQAGATSDRSLFSAGAIRTIYRKTGGHPRKIITLCHHALLGALMAQREEVTERIVRRAIRQMRDVHPWRVATHRWRWAGALGLLAAIGLMIYGPLADWKPFSSSPDGVSLSSSKETPKGRSKVPATPPPQEARDFEEPGGTALTAITTVKQNGSGAHPPIVEEPKVWSPAAWFALYSLGDEDLDPGRKIVVRKGDTLSGLVERYYRAPLSAPLLAAIQRANPGLVNPHRLRIGDRLILPPREDSPRGFYSESAGWFPAGKAAEAWAAKVAREKGIAFVVRVRQDGRPAFGVFKGIYSKEIKGQSAGGVKSVWVEQDQVIHVYQLAGDHGRGMLGER